MRENRVGEGLEKGCSSLRKGYYLWEKDSRRVSEGQIGVSEGDFSLSRTDGSAFYYESVLKYVGQIG